MTGSDETAAQRSAFAKLALDRLKRSRPSETFVLDEDRFQITQVYADGKSSLMSLHNYFDEWVHAAPERRAGVFDRIVKFSGLIDSGETLDEVRVMLMPRIRPRRYFVVDAVEMMKSVVDTRASAKAGAEPKTPPPYTPLGTHLGVAVAIDRPEHIEYVNGVDRFKVSKEELDAIAIANLRRHTPGGFEEMRPGLWVGQWGDEYASERMLLPHLFEAIAPKLRGDPVAFIPGAERMFVVGSEDEENLLLALVLVEERTQAPRAILDFGFVWRGGGWETFEPPGPFGAELGRRLAVHLAGAYAHQAELLEAERTAGTFDGAVAPLMGLGEGDELTATVAAWPKEADLLLPRAHLVSLGTIAPDRSGDAKFEEIVTVPWQVLMAVAGDCLVPEPALYPPRWRARRFPDDAAIAKMKAAAAALATEAEAAPVSSLRRPPPSAEAPAITPDGSRRARTWMPIAIAAALVVAVVAYFALAR